MNSAFYLGIFCVIIFVYSGYCNAFDIGIVHTGGIEGKVAPILFPSGDENEARKYGGMARMVAVFQKIEARHNISNTPFLKIGYGNLFGITEFDDVFRGRDPVVNLTERHGFSSMGLGQSDLFLGPSSYEEGLKYMTDLNIVCANIELQGSGLGVSTLRSKVKEYVLENVKDSSGTNRKIAIISVTSPTTCRITSCVEASDKIIFTPMAPAIERVIPKIKKEHGPVDLIIVNVVSTAERSTNPLTEVQDLIKATKGVGVFLSGDRLHFSTRDVEKDLFFTVDGKYPEVIKNKENKDVILASVEGGTAFVGDLTVNVIADGMAIKKSANVHALGACTKKISPESNLCAIPDTEAYEEISEWAKVATELSNKPIGEAETAFKFPFPDCHFMDCDVSVLVADVIMKSTEGACDVVLVNVGAIRSSLTSGNITKRHIRKVLPYNSFISNIEITGETLVKILRYSIDNIPADLKKLKSGASNARYLVTAGIKYSFNPNLPSKDKIFKLSVDKNKDVAFNPAEYFHVCLPTYLVRGGDGYNIEDIKSQDEELGTMNAMLQEYIDLHYTLTHAKSYDRAAISTTAKIHNFCYNDCKPNGKCVGLNQCECNKGYSGYECNEKIPVSVALIASTVSISTIIVTVLVALFVYKWRKMIEKDASRRRVLLDNEQITDVVETKNGCSAVASYRGEKVRVSYMHPEALSQTDYAHLLDLISMHHKNIVNFVGVIPDPCCMVIEYGSVGGLGDALAQKKLPRDTDLICSISRDTLSGILYLHARNIGHGMLMPSSLVLSSDFTCKVSNFHLHGYQLEPEPVDLVVWLAPEVLNQIMPGMMDEEFVNRILADIFLSGNVNAIEADHYGFGMCIFSLITYNPYPWGEEVHTNEERGFVREALRISIITEGQRPPEPDRDIMINEWGWKHGDREFTLYDAARAYLAGSASDRPSLLDLRETLNGMVPNLTKVMSAMTNKYTARLEQVATERTKELMAEKKDAEDVLASVGNLLSRILPDDVLLRLKSGSESVTDTFENGVVCIFGILNFESMVVDDPMSSVIMLNSVFRQIDEVAIEAGIINTVTDAGEYMCAVVSGTRKSNIELILFFATTALSRIEVHLPDDSMIRVSAGVSCGTVHAGIVGRKTLRYTLFGPGIDSARDMATASDVKPDRVHVDKSIVDAFGNHNVIAFKFHSKDAFLVEIADENAAAAELRPKRKQNPNTKLSGRDKLMAVKSLITTGALSSMAPSATSSLGIGSPGTSRHRGSAASGGSDNRTKVSSAGRKASTTSNKSRHRKGSSDSTASLIISRQKRLGSTGSSGVSDVRSGNKSEENTLLEEDEDMVFNELNAMEMNVVP